MHMAPKGRCKEEASSMHWSAVHGKVRVAILLVHQSVCHQEHRYSRIAVGLLVVTFVVFHVECHAALPALEAGFVPYLSQTHTELTLSH